MREKDDEKKEVLSWGIIGCGDVVKRKSGPALLDSEGSRVKAVMRRSLSKAREYASKNDIPVATDKADVLLDDPEIDLIYVATPPSSHRKYTIAAAEAGMDVLVEKPMALNQDSARDMVEVCDESGVELFVAYYRRFYPHVKKMRDMIRDGLIGEPVQSYVYLSFAPPEDSGWREEIKISGGGWFVDVASHRVDLLTHLFGSVSQAKAVVSSFESGNALEDTVTGSIKFDTGIQTGIQADFYSGGSADEFYVHGTEGSIYTEDLSDFQVTLEKGGEVEEYEFSEFSAPHYGLIEHVEDVLLDEARNEAAGSEVLETEKVLDQLIRDSY